MATRNRVLDIAPNAEVHTRLDPHRKRDFVGASKSSFDQFAMNEVEAKELSHFAINQNRTAVEIGRNDLNFVQQSSMVSSGDTDVALFHIEVDMLAHHQFFDGFDLGNVQTAVCTTNGHINFVGSGEGGRGRASFASLCGANEG